MATIFLVEVPAYVQGSSTTLHTIGTGSKSFTLAADIRFVVGMTVIADAGSNNTMTGTVTSQSGLSLVLNVTSTTGSGTFASWTIGGNTTLRFSTGRGYNHASAPGFYEPRILQAANFKQEIFSDLRTYGSSKISYGEIVLINTDHALDHLIEYGYGDTTPILSGDETAAYNTFAAVLKGIIEQPILSLTDKGSQISFRFRDRQQELERPVQPAKFAGTNSGSTGIEGTADTIKGQPKPRLWGKVLNITPVLINAPTLIYGVNFNRNGNTASVNSIDNIYVGGSVLTYSGTNRANLAAMQGSAPASGQYDICTSEGLIRLGSSPSHAITCDVTQGATTSDRYAGSLIKTILLDAGITNGDINSSDITTLNTDAPYIAGVYVDSETTYLEILDKIAGSINAWYSPDSNNAYRIQQLKTPIGSPVYTFKRYSFGTVAKANEGDIISIQRLATNDDGRGIPAYKTNLNYAFAQTKQAPGELTGSVTDSRKRYLDKGFLTVTSATDSNVQKLYKQSQELNFDTVLINEADAQAICNARYNFYRIRHDLYELKVKLSAELMSAIRRGSVVKLELPFFGLSAGKLFVVTGITYDALGETMTIRVLS